MGGILSYLLSWVSTPTASDQNPDPNTGLTDRDRQLIQQTWALVADKKTVTLNGVELFVQLFRTYPHMQDYFKQFKGMSESELRKTPKMRVHALGVMNLFNSYINNLSEVETLVALIQKMSFSHYRRGIYAPEFEKLTTMLLPYLKSILGSQFTPEVEASWTKLMTTHNVIVGQTMEAAARGSKDDD